MNTLTWTAPLMVALLPAMGCSGASPSGTNPSDKAPGAASAGNTGSPPEEASVSIQGFVRTSDGAPIAGATVCPLAEGTGQDTADCRTTGADGSFTLTTLANAWVAITFAKTGFVSTVRAVETQTGVMTLPGAGNVMLPAAEPLVIAGVTADPGMGQVAFTVMGSGGLGGGVPASVTMGGTASPAAPIYVGSDGSPAAGATSGTQGVFANVPPGLYSLHFSQPSVTCSPLSLYGWPMTEYQSAGEASVVVPVMAGYVTAPVAASCESAP